MGRPQRQVVCLMAAIAWFWAGPLHAEILTFQAVLDRALAISFDRQIAAADLAISGHRQDETRALWYPSLSLRFYNAYDQMVGDSETGVVVVGDAVSSAAQPLYQHSLIAGAQWLLYDFGARGGKLRQAQRQVRISRLALDQTELDLKIQVVKAYAAVLTLFGQLKACREEITLRKQIFQLTQRLAQAGTVGNERVQQAALKLAETVGREDILAARLTTALSRLAYFTGWRLDSHETVLADFSPPPFVFQAPVDPCRLPEMQALEQTIAQHREELAIARKEMFPRLVLQSHYRFFGEDDNRFEESLRDLAPRDAAVVLVAEWEFFAGFRDAARLRRLQAQLRRAGLEKAKRLAELEHEIAGLQFTRQAGDQAFSRHRQRLAGLDDNRDVVQRLGHVQQIDQVAVLERQIEILQDEVNAQGQRIEHVEAAYRLFFYQQGQQ